MVMVEMEVNESTPAQTREAVLDLLRFFMKKIATEVDREEVRQIYKKWLECGLINDDDFKEIGNKLDACEAGDSS
jgi:hypothetical protein